MTQEECVYFKRQVFRRGDELNWNCDERIRLSKYDDTALPKIYNKTIKNEE